MDNPPRPPAGDKPPSESGGVDPDLGRKVRSSLGWAVLGQLAQRGAAWISTLVLARLLDLEDYGTYSIAVTVSLFLLAFNDVGVSYAVARHQDDDADQLAGTASSLALATSVALYALVFFLAPAIVSVFDPPAGSPAVGVVRLAAVVIIIDASVAAHAGAVSRALAERVRTFAELGGFTVSLGLMLGLALAGSGPWALAIGQVGGSFVTATLLRLRSPMRIRFLWDRDRAAALVRFGLPLMAAGTFNQLILNSDYVIVNRYLSTAVAGAYFIAFNVSNWPVALLNFAIRRTAVSGFARFGADRAGLERAFLTAMETLIALTVPFALLIALNADEILALLFPARYGIGATALAFLAGISVLRLAFSLCIDLLTSLGRTTVILGVQAIWWVAAIFAMRWGAIHHGLAGVGVAQLGAAVGVALPILWWRLRANGIRVGRLGGRVGRVALGAAALACACIAAQSPFDASFWRLSAGGVAGTLAYAVVVLPATPLPDLLRERLGRSRTPHPPSR